MAAPDESGAKNISLQSFLCNMGLADPFAPNIASLRSKLCSRFNDSMMIERFDAYSWNRKGVYSANLFQDFVNAYWQAEKILHTKDFPASPNLTASLARLRETPLSDNNMAGELSHLVKLVGLSEEQYFCLDISQRLGSIRFNIENPEWYFDNILKPHVGEVVDLLETLGDQYRRKFLLATNHVC
jgi:hypothetical protein